MSLRSDPSSGDCSNKTEEITSKWQPSVGNAASSIFDEIVERAVQSAKSESSSNKEHSTTSSTTVSASNPHWIQYSEEDPWQDSLRPTVKFLDSDQVQDLEDDNIVKGVLTGRMIISGLSHLSSCPLVHIYSLSKLQLRNMDLLNVDKLEDYSYLQYIDISHNIIEDLTPLGGLPFLMYLDASHNRICSGLKFRAPLFLSYVDLSHNRIESINDLKSFWSLIQLNLSNNKIRKIEGLQDLRYLRRLDLSFNLLTRIENLDNLRLTHLLLQNNQISECELGKKSGLKTLQHLIYINLNNNELTSLTLFKDVSCVRFIDVRHNLISELFEISDLRSLTELREIDMTGNQVESSPDFRKLMAGFLPSLTLLSGSPVSSEEKIRVRPVLDPHMQMEAVRKHAFLMMMEQLNSASIEKDLLPVDDYILPFVILVGPAASKKGFLVRKIAEEFPEKIYAGKSYTSRKPTIDEQDGVHYYFQPRDKIHQMAHSGMFLSFSEIMGHSYGFGHSELIHAVYQQRLCLTHMDLIGALSIYKRGLRPHLILTISEDESAHLERLKDKYSAINKHGAHSMEFKKKIECFGPGCTKIDRASSNRLEDLIVKDCTIGPNSNELFPKNCGESKICGKQEEVDTLLRVRRSPRGLNDQQIKAMIDSRKDYFDLHKSKDGFFEYVLFTDNLNEAYKELVKIVKKCYVRKLDAGPLSSIENEKHFITASSEKLNHYMKQINCHNDIDVPQTFQK